MALGESFSPLKVLDEYFYYIVDNFGISEITRNDRTSDPLYDSLQILSDIFKNNLVAHDFYENFKA